MNTLDEEIAAELAAGDETEQTGETGTENVEDNKDVESTPPAKTGKRANWVIAHEVKGAVITWNVKDAGKLTLDMEKLSDAIRSRAAIHGMVQRISDAAAIPRDTKTGKSATAQEKLDAMSELVEHYLTGTSEWNRKGAGRGPRELTGAALLRAALELWQPEKGAEKIAVFVKGLKQGQIAALLSSAELKEAVELARAAELEAMAGEEVNAEELLGGL